MRLIDIRDIRYNRSKDIRIFFFFFKYDSPFFFKYFAKEEEEEEKRLFLLSFSRYNKSDFKNWLNEATSRRCGLVPVVENIQQSLRFNV